MISSTRGSKAYSVVSSGNAVPSAARNQPTSSPRASGNPEPRGSALAPGPRFRGADDHAWAELQLGHMSDPLKFLDESLSSGWVQVSPRYQKSNKASLLCETRQTIGRDRRSVRDRDGKVRLRAPRLQKVFHSRPMPAHCRRDENGARHTRLRRKVCHLHNIFVDKFFRQ